MLRGGALPAPVIKPLRYDTIGTRIKVGPNTYIQIICDVPGVRIYFTTDGTKPDQFQLGRTGKASTHKYIGPFRLQPGSRVVRAMAVTRDRLRESPVATRYIDVQLEPKSLSTRFSDHDLDQDDSSSFSDDNENENNQFAKKFPDQQRRPSATDMAEIQGSIDGPINPINYSGTQINIWGFPTPDIGNLIEPKSQQPNMGFLTEQMIKNLNTPKAIDKPPADFQNLPESLRKFFKQIQKLYERDTEFQNVLDYLIENAQVKNADMTEKYDSFILNIVCPKFLVDPKPLPKPKPPAVKRPQSPPIEIFKPAADIHRPPSPPPVKVQPEIPKSPPPTKTTTKPTTTPTQPPPQPPKPPVDEGPKIYIEELQQHGTIVDAPNFDADADAKNLRDSVKGLGTKEKVIIDIVGNRSNAQRQKIKDRYKAMFGRDLVEDLQGDTSGNFKKLLTGLMLTPVEFDCVEIRKAIQGLGTDNGTLIEIITSRSNNRIKEISQLYNQMYKKKLEDDVVSDTSGAYKKLLVSLLTASRPETQEVDMNLVKKDVDDLVAAGVKRWGTDDSKFNTIFGIRSYAHLRRMFDEYQKRTGKAIEEAIKSEMSGNLAKTYLALISNIRDKPGYFASQIKKAVKGLGTDEHTLNRVIVSRSEVDLVQVKEDYEKLFKVSMEKDVLDDVSGDYGKLLLMLMKDPSQRIYLDSKGQVQDNEPHVVEQVEEPKIAETPVLVDFAGFNAASDAERLRKAMKGLGTDEKTLIEILGNRTCKQRQEIKAAFTQAFGRDLIKDLESETSGHFKETLKCLMMTPTELDAWQFHHAIAGLGTDEPALIELLTTRTPEQLAAIKQEYQSSHKKSLEEDIKGDTSGTFREILISLLNAGRASGNMVDKTQAKLDAQNLINSGIKKWGTADSNFTTLMCTRSYAQLRAMFDEYQKFQGHSIQDDLKKEYSGDVLKSFLAIVECIQDKQSYFAEVLLKAMKGFGTKESALIRVIVSRCEIDLVQIKQKFEVIAKESLAKYISSDTSGDFKRVLLTLIGEPSK